MVLSLPRNKTTARDVEDAASPLRVPPHNYEAERALLGTILMNPRAFERVSEFLGPEHFADPVNGRIYEACAKLIDQGHQANPITLKTYLERDDLIIAAGGMKYLANLVGGAGSVINAGDYGKLIKDLWKRRALIDAAMDLMTEAFESDMDVSAEQIEDGHVAKLLQLSPQGQYGSVGLVPINEVYDATVSSWDKDQYRNPGVTTGYPDLDKKLGGLHPGNLVVLAGRPSMGKTALATCIAYHSARFYQNSEDIEFRNKCVAFFSGEMQATEIGGRLITGETRVPAPRNRNGDSIREDEWSKIIKAGNVFENMPLYIDDAGGFTVSTIRSRCIKLSRKSQVGLIVIDYLQLVKPERWSKAQNENQILGEITQALKELAKELRVPVLLLSQLNRSLESREDKRPNMADLRGSGSIEQDADVIMFVYRAQYYLERSEPKRKPGEGDSVFFERFNQWQELLSEVTNLCEVICPKQRGGPIFNAPLFFDGPRTWLENWGDGSLQREQQNKQQPDDQLL